MRTLPALELTMRIVITGGAGFLGSRLARKLLERGTLTDARGNARSDRIAACCSTSRRRARLRPIRA